MPRNIDFDGDHGDLIASAYNRGTTVRELADNNHVSYGTMHRFLSSRDDVVMRRTGPPSVSTDQPAAPPARPPGRIIRAHLSRVGVPQAVAAKRMRVQPYVLTLIIQGKRTITVPMARKLETALQIDALHLLTEQARWQLHQLTPRRT